MRYLACLCGARIEAADGDALVTAFFRHTDEAHPEITVSAERRRDIEDAIRRTGGWDGQQSPLDSPVEVRPLTPDAGQDYLAFFDHDAFPDNPVWARCYCLSYQLALTPQEFDARSAAENRADKADSIARGESSGVLAYSGGRVVGWCHAAPRRSLSLLDRTPGFSCDDPDRTGAIACFVIAPQYRGRGLARKLLDGACNMLRERGFEHIEAYPPKDSATAAGSYHGRLDMYLSAGFQQIRDAGRYAVVRRAL